MDYFNREKCKNVGPGGTRCPCCNSLHHKSRKKLNRMARARCKANLIKELNDNDEHISKSD
jgi:hypothetical protein